MSFVWGVLVGKFYLLRFISLCFIIVSDLEYFILCLYVNVFWYINWDNEFINIWKLYIKRIKKKILLEI